MRGDALHLWLVVCVLGCAKASPPTTEVPSLARFHGADAGVAEQAVPEAPAEVSNPVVRAAIPAEPDVPADAGRLEEQVEAANESELLAAQIAEEGDAERDGPYPPEPTEDESKARRPATSKARAAAEGRRIYRNVCMLCHDIGPNIEGVGWPAARMERQIRRGASA